MSKKLILAMLACLLVLVCTACGGGNSDPETEAADEPDTEISEEVESPEEEPEETPDGVDAISGEKAPVKKIANIPPAGNPLFVLLISLMSLCFVSLRGKK